MASPSETENLKSSVSDEKEKSENDLLASNKGHKISRREHSSDSEYESAEEDQNIVDDEEEEIEEILTEEVKKVRIKVTCCHNTLYRVPQHLLVSLEFRLYLPLYHIASSVSAIINMSLTR